MSKLRNKAFMWQTSMLRPGHKMITIRREMSGEYVERVIVEISNDKGSMEYTFAGDELGSLLSAMAELITV